MIAKLKTGLEHVYYVESEKAKEMLKEVEDVELETFRRIKAQPDLSLDKPLRRDSLLHFSRFPLQNTPEVLPLLPSLDFATGAAILPLVANATPERPLPILLEPEFANDGLCDYAYVIDLDKEVFEIYGEPCDKPPGHHRFEAADRDDSRVPSFMASLAFADRKSHLDNKTYLKAVNEQIEKSRKK